MDVAKSPTGIRRWWRSGGSLQLADSHFPSEVAKPSWLEALRVRIGARLIGVQLSHDLMKELTTAHIASPDVHIDEANRRFVMYFHGLEKFAEQATRVATSNDGVHFEAHPELLGRTYFRAFDHDGQLYTLAIAIAEVQFEP